MNSEKLEIYRKKVIRADEINSERAKNQMLLAEIENRMNAIFDKKANSSITLLGAKLEGDVALGVLEKAQLVLLRRNKELTEEYEAL